MRTWTRLAITRQCGDCGLTIYPEQPICTVLIPGVKRALVRCSNCAGEAVPADLPEVAPLAAPVRQAVNAFGFIPVDFKQRASGSE